MTGHTGNPASLDRGQLALQLMGWMIVALLTIGPAQGAPHLRHTPSADAAAPEKQSGRGKSRYTRLEAVLDDALGRVLADRRESAAFMRQAGGLSPRRLLGGR